MKKLVLLLMVLMLPLAFAQGTEADIDAETKAELEVMDTMPGAQMRLLQLERAIQTNILIGEEVVARIQAEYEADTTELQNILLDLEELKESVATMNVTTDASVAAQEFVEVKSSARVLVKEFREEARAIIPRDDREEIRTAANARVRTNAQIGNLTAEIQERRTDVNRERGLNIATRAGLSAEAIALLRAGTVTNVSEFVLSQIRAAPAEVRANVRAHVREQQAKRAVIKAAVEDRIDNISARVLARIQAIPREDVRAQVESIIGVRIAARQEAREQRQEDMEQRHEARDSRDTASEGPRGGQASARVNGSISDDGARVDVGIVGGARR